jgi:hypothetical protein
MDATESCNAHRLADSPQRRTVGAVSEELYDPAPLSDRVHQAQGMVAAQLGCSMEEALGRLRVRADATGQALDELALDVLDGIVRFEP